MSRKKKKRGREVHPLFKSIHKYYIPMDISFTCQLRTSDNQSNAKENRHTRDIAEVIPWANDGSLLFKRIIKDINLYTTLSYTL